MQHPQTPPERKEQSLIGIVLSAVLILGGIRTFVTGRAGLHAAFAEGLHVKVAGALVFAVGLILLFQSVSKK